MDISPAPSSLAAGGSPGSGGMGWLLDPGPSKTKSSAASLLSASGSAYGNYYGSVNNNGNNNGFAEGGGPRMPASATSSIPEIAEIAYSYSEEQPERPRVRNREPVVVDVLSQSVRTCAFAIFGLYGVEVWRLDGSGSLVCMPLQPNDAEGQSGGLFVKRVTQEADYDSPDFTSSARDAFERLTDATRLDHIYEETTEPGVGLAGALWSEASTSKTLAAVQNGVQTISETIHRRVSLLRAGLPGLSHETESVLWREVDTLAEDPDQPYNERLQLFAKAGFKLAAGIPFDVKGFRGIVIFHANPHTDALKLRDPDNSRLIQFAAQFIGAAAAVHVPIKEATISKNMRPIKNWNRLRVKILAVVRFRKPVARRRARSRSMGSPTIERINSFRKGMRRAASFAMSREASLKLLSEATTRARNSVRDVVRITQKSVTDARYASKAKGMKWWQKCKGGHGADPPPFNGVQCMWTFVGVWTTHVLLSWLDYFVVGESGGDRQLILGPLGALTTLQFNLTAAPASQPRNAFFSQIVALSVSHFLHQVRDLDRWHRMALAPAIVATTTARLGIIHPPAGAASVVFSLDIYTPTEMLVFLVGVVIAIIMAVVINNLSDKRQYPSTSWVTRNWICRVPSSFDR